jgi:methionyl-tRNA formyltransferase
MRIVFMGSPELSVPALRAIVRAGHEVPLVVTQLSRRAGRGMREMEPAVGVAARELGLEIFQPKAMRSERTHERIRSAQPDVIVVVAYGRILPLEILEIPTRGCTNVHLSLLPRHRGAAPISGALLSGDPLTGVSIMIMEEGLDTGPVLAQAMTPITRDDDQLTLTSRLADLGADLLIDLLPRWQAGEVEPRPQDETQATWTHPTQRADARLDWSRPALDLWRVVRAYADWPIAHTTWNGKLLRILKAAYDPSVSLAPGLVAAVGEERRKRAIQIGTSDGVLLPEVLGVEGKRTLPVSDFLQGYPSLIGATLAS